MKAASSGFKYPNAARPTPIVSTTSVPTKFCMIVLRQCRAVRKVSASFDKSLPISTTSALSRAASVPDPIATPTDACINAGASLIPSPTMATLCPFSIIVRTKCNLSSGNSPATISSTPSLPPTSSATPTTGSIAATAMSAWKSRRSSRTTPSAPSPTRAGSGPPSTGRT